MCRYMERDECGSAHIIGVDAYRLQTNLSMAEFNIVADALNKFAAYEDIGLEPNEIAEKLKKLAEHEEIGEPKELDEALFNAYG